MNKIRTILVDDEPRGLSSLQKLLQYICPEVEVIGLCQDAIEAREKIELHKPDLVFLDIAMPQKTGFDLLKELYPVKFEIIFVTAYEKFMMQAFRFSVVDYLLKPVEDDLLREAVNRAIRRIEEKSGGTQLETLLQNIQNREGPQKMKLCIPSVKGYQVVNLSEIIYFEASGNYTNIHFVSRPVICSARLIHEYESMLEDSGFVRVHKTFLVNMQHVNEYQRGEGGQLVLSNGDVVEVSRRKKDLLLTRMKEFYKF